MNLNATNWERRKGLSSSQALTGWTHLRVRLLTVLWTLVPGLSVRCGVPRPPGVHVLEDYFTDEAILRRVVRLRLKIAKKRHDQYFLFNLNHTHKNPDTPRTAEDAVASMMPPRRAWLHPTKTIRKSVPASRVAELCIENTIRKTRALLAPPPWFIRLSVFTKQTRRKVISIGSRTFLRRTKFDAPRVGFAIKDKQKKTYRPIATYTTQDQVIIGVAAQQLRDTIDRHLTEHSYAFRAKGPDGSKPKARNDALLDLVTFIKRHKGRLLYVAECDIQKFFDAVSHRVARTELLALLNCASESGQYYDPRLLRIFDAYLAAYNFQSSVEEVAPSYFAGKGLSGASVPWVREELAVHYGNRLPTDIGVSQGGALSPIIANIVLHAADKAVRRCAERLGNPDYCYLRYCDDMIIVSPSKKTTDALFDAYKTELTRLKLPFHTPETIERFTKGFFKVKSRATYAFGAPSLGSKSPWIAFLGYHIRYDGRFRVRKDSIQKEIEKQLQIFTHVVKSIDRHGAKMRVGRRQAVHRARSRMIAMSVGQVEIGRHGPTVDHEMCWVAGFELLKTQPYVASQLKILDRAKGRFLSRLRIQLAKKLVPGIASGAKTPAGTLPHYGRPFSYYAQFKR